MPNIVLGVCGGIAAYKSAYLASGLCRRGFIVRTVMTPSALEFITPLTFETLTREKVYTGLFKKSYDENHTSIAAWADLAVIAPATANTVARLANGMADELLSAFLLDFTGPIFVCPAMHENMYKNPATVDNLEKLKARGGYIIGPVLGALAGGGAGLGRMEEPDNIISEIESIIKRDFPSFTLS